MIISHRVKGHENAKQSVNVTLLKGTTCYIGDQQTKLCGKDEDGFTYYNSDEHKSLTCADDGAWKTATSPDPVTGPVCQANPCKSLSEADVANSVAVNCSGASIKGLAFTLF